MEKQLVDEAQKQMGWDGVVSFARAETQLAARRFRPELNPSVQKDNDDGKRHSRENVFKGISLQSVSWKKLAEWVTLREPRARVWRPPVDAGVFRLRSGYF